MELKINVEINSNIDIDEILEKAIKKKIKKEKDTIYVRIKIYDEHNGREAEVRKIIKGKRKVREYLSMIAERMIDEEVEIRYKKDILEIESVDGNRGTNNYMRIINLKEESWEGWIKELEEDKGVTNKTRKKIKKFNKKRKEQE